VTCATITPDNSRVVTGSEDGSLKVWDITSGRELQQFGGDDSGVLSLVISPDGAKLVSGHKRGGIQVWELKTGRTC